MAVSVALSASREEDGTVELCVAFASAKFAGSGSAYFQSTELSSFAKALDAYPIDKQKAPLLSGGYWDATAKRVEEEHVGMSVEPRGSLGKLLLTIRVALPADERGAGSQKSSAMIQIEVEYAQLSTLSLHLQLLADGSEKEFSMTFV